MDMHVAVSKRELESVCADLQYTLVKGAQPAPQARRRDLPSSSPSDLCIGKVQSEGNDHVEMQRGEGDAAVQVCDDTAALSERIVHLTSDTKLDEHARNREKLGQAGAVQVLIALLRRDATLGGDTVVRVLKAIHCVAYGNNDNKEKLAACDGVATVLHTMKLHTMNATLQAEACWCLNVATFCCPTNKRAARALGAHEVFEQARRAHAMDSGVQWEARDALRRLSCWP